MRDVSKGPRAGSLVVILIAPSTTGQFLSPETKLLGSNSVPCVLKTPPPPKLPQQSAPLQDYNVFIYNIPMSDYITIFQ